MGLVVFHFIAKAPDQERGRIAVATNDVAGPLELRFHLVGIVIVEPLTFVSEPDARGHGEAQFLSLVQLVDEVVSAPRADGVAADLDQQWLGCRAADTLDKIGLAVALQLPTAVRLDHFGVDRAITPCSEWE